MTISVTKDGRTKLTGKHYTAFRYELWMAQNRKCIECGRVTDIQAELHRDDSFHTDHLNGRGLGGSKRDDTFKSCVGKCGRCHRIKHGQQQVVPSQLQWSRKS